jgi:transcriptional regulator with XRE-family HTH domain
MINVKIETEVPAGEMIRRLRIEKGLSVDELAKRSGTTPPSISRWERGLRTPSVNNYQLVIEALGAELAIVQK